MDTKKVVVKYQSLEELHKSGGLPSGIKTEVHLWDEILKKELSGWITGISIILNARSMWMKQLFCV